MPYFFEELDADTRRYMVLECQRDMARDHFVLYKRLTEEGRAAYRKLLLRALEAGDEQTLTESLAQPEFFISSEPYSRGGKVAQRKVSHPAAASLIAETEFNAYYMRGLCRKLMAEGVTRVMVYRAKETENPREGKRVTPGDIWFTCEALDDLRLRESEMSTKRGFLRGPRSGISLRRVPPGITEDEQILASDIKPLPPIF
ncbi:MAG TPA: hypothetical protein VGL38_00445 [bacterium]|jgi:hypothetical protein